MSTREGRGECRCCGIEPEHGKTMCRGCLDRYRLRTLKSRDLAIARGLCGNCRCRTKLDNSGYCETCYIKKVARTRLGSQEHWEELRERLLFQNYLCAYTGELLVLGVNDSVDHIFPISRFPERKQDPENIEWVTRVFNWMKSDRTPDELLKTMGTVLEYRYGYSLQDYPKYARV